MPLVVNGVQIDITEKLVSPDVIKQVAADAQALEVQNNKLGASSVGAGDDIAGMGTNLVALGATLSMVTVAAGAFVAAFEFGEIAAGNERLINSGEQLARGYGQSLDTIVSKVKEASLGTVSNMHIIASSNKAMMLGVGGDADQLAKLMEIAAFRGRAMGISTSQAFDDMSRGIGRMSPMILDNLGIIVDAKTTYGNYAESIGKSANELTRAEKIQALLNKVIEEGNRQLDEAGGLTEDNATSYERFHAELDNTKNSLLENTLGMSRLADMGATFLSTFNDVTGDQSIGEMFVKNATGANAFNIAMGFLEERVAKGKEEQWAAADAVHAHADALDGILPKIQSVSDAQTEAVEVDEEAVKGAMKVHDTYEKLGEKMTDLQADHDELLAKKQELIDQGWWAESQKIKDVNDKLAENEQKQLDVTVAMQGTLAQMLLNTAAAGLDAEGQLALARATGQIDEASYAALTAQAGLKKQYEDGGLSAQEYASKTVELKDAVARLQSKHITITADAIFNELRTITTSYQTYNGNYSGNYSQLAAGGGYADGGISTGPLSGHMELLHGTEAVIPLKNGSVPVDISGIPSGGGGNITIQLMYAPTVSFGTEAEANEKMLPFILSGIQQAKANGQI